MENNDMQAKAVDISSRMNKTESRYAARLDILRVAGNIQAWSFEPEKLRLAESCYYTPDFRIVENDGTITFVDVKGGKSASGRLLAHDDAIVKCKSAAQVHPYRFKLTWENKRGSWEERVYEPRD